MDSTQTSAVIGPSAVPLVRAGPCQPLLCGAARIGRELAVDASAGRRVHAASVLRGAPDDLLAANRWPSRGTQAGTAATAIDGFIGRVSEAAAELQPLGTPALSLPVAGCRPGAAQSGVEHRHHLHSAAGRVRLFGGGH